MAITLHYDNHSALALVANPKFHERTKHIAIDHHYICALVAENVVSLVYCPTQDMITDLLTKYLSSPQEAYLLGQVGLLGGAEVHEHDPL